jgi:nicotinate-nucleotide adenylyltransferase
LSKEADKSEPRDRRELNSKIVKRRIGIIGGTFDPIHIGHLVIAEEALTELQLEKVIFIPAGNPPHKPNEPITDAAYRLAMTKLAISGNPAFEVSTIEMERKGPSYTVDTIEELRATFGEDVDLFFIMGVDSVLEIPTWHQPGRILSMCIVAAATRPGCNESKARQVLPVDFLDRIVFLRTPGVDISSTELRNRIALGKSIRYLVPHSVEDYIHNNKLYKVEK